MDLGLDQNLFNLIAIGLFAFTMVGQLANYFYYRYKTNNMHKVHEFHGSRLYERQQSSEMKINAMLAKMPHLEEAVDLLQNESETYRDQIDNLEAFAQSQKIPKAAKELGTRVKKAIKSNKEARADMKNRDIKSTRFHSTLKDHTIAPKSRIPKEVPYRLTSKSKSK